MTPQPANIFHKRLSDKRAFNEIRREYGFWRGYYEAVKNGDMPRPTIMPIRRMG